MLEDQGIFKQALRVPETQASRAVVGIQCGGRYGAYRIGKIHGGSLSGSWNGDASGSINPFPTERCFCFYLSENNKPMDCFKPFLTWLDK
jgi:hypothetical protein